jgi:hypothetical protein
VVGVACVASTAVGTGVETQHMLGILLRMSIRSHPPPPHREPVIRASSNLSGWPACAISLPICLCVLRPSPPVLLADAATIAFPRSGSSSSHCRRIPQALGPRRRRLALLARWVTTVGGGGHRREHYERLDDPTLRAFLAGRQGSGGVGHRRTVAPLGGGSRWDRRRRGEQRFRAGAEARHRVAA